MTEGRKNKKNASAEKKEDSLQIQDAIAIEPVVEFFEETLNQVFTDQREHFLMSIKEKILNNSGLARSETALKQSESEWVNVESLSKLRSLVGGRFQNIKSKWLAAGFPLKEKNSGNALSYTLDENGWIELSSWISRQGYEVRGAPDETSGLFQIKQKSI